MTQEKKILAIIPARSGSKSIPHKNIKSLLGKPLIAYSIEHALASKLINKVIVSTDNADYAAIAKKYGAEVPFLRPSDLSQDHSNDIEFVQHTLAWLKENENYVPDICVQLRPTHPIRNPDDIDKMIQMLIDNSTADSVRSIVENTNTTPYKMWFRSEHNELNPLLTLHNIEEPYNTARQLLPKTYFQNASVDVIRTNCVLEKNSLSGKKILGYIMDGEFDIDYEADFDKVEKFLLKNEIDFTKLRDKKFCFDIDGVIASLTLDNDYAKATPMQETIDLINILYNNNNKIILFTARGTETGIDWKNTTEQQMNNWGVKHHELRFGKPGADYFIDDRAININAFKK